MMRSLRILFWGLLISFLGTLPLGTLNVAAMQISISEGIYTALLFAVGCLLVEMTYVRLSLISINWIRKNERLLKIMEWVTLLVVLALAIGSFYAATSPNPSTRNLFLDNNINRFLLGLFMSAMNPVQIPFWFGWSSILFAKGILKAKKEHYNLYIVGIGIGTLLGNAVFIFGGRLLVDRISKSAVYINWIIGAIFLITAIIQLIKILTHKDAVDKIKHLGEHAIHEEKTD